MTRRNGKPAPDVGPDAGGMLAKQTALLTEAYNAQVKAAQAREALELAAAKAAAEAAEADEQVRLWRAFAKARAEVGGVAEQAPLRPAFTGG